MDIGKPKRVIEVEPEPARRERAVPEREERPAQPVPERRPAKVPVPA